MLMNKSGSYYENFRRSTRKGSEQKSSYNPSKTNLEDERLLTDRSAYISFLEVQLERVSAACLTSQSFSDRIEEVQASVLNFDERLHNVSRSVRLVESTTKHDASAATEKVLRLEGKFDELEGGIEELERKSSQANETIGSLKKSMELFEDKQKARLDGIRRGLEQGLLELSTRVDLEEVRSQTNQAKISGLGDLSRTETKTAIDSFQAEVDIRIEAHREQQDFRVSALENRLSMAIDHLKEDIRQSMSALPPSSSSITGIVKSTANSPRVRFEPETQLRQEIEETRRNLTEQNEGNIKRVMETLRSLEQKLNQSRREVNQTQRIESQEVQDTLVAMSQRMTELEKKLALETKEKNELRSEIQKLRKHMQDDTKASIKSTLAKHSTKIIALQDERIQEHIQEAVTSQNKKIRLMLQAVEKKLKQQTDLVTESMVKVERFMDLYHATQTDLHERLAQGKMHQERLNKLLEESAAALDHEQNIVDTVGHDQDPQQSPAVSSFQNAYHELSEIVKDMSFDEPIMLRSAMKQEKKKKKQHRKKKRSLSAEPGHQKHTVSSRRRSKTPPPFMLDSSDEADDDQCLAQEKTLHRDGGGKKGRDTLSMRSSSTLKETLTDGAGNTTTTEPLASTQPSSSSGSKIPWNSPDTHPAKDKGQRRRKLKQLYKELSSMK